MRSRTSVLSQLFHKQIIYPPEVRTVDLRTPCLIRIDTLNIAYVTC